MTDIHSVLLVDTNHASSLLTRREFVWPIQRALSVPSGVISLSALTEKSTRGYDALILGGCTLADNYYLSRLPSLKWLRGFSKPVLGICAGQHIVGSLFGGRVSPFQFPAIGVHSVRRTRDHPFLGGYPSSFDVYSLHGNQVSLPKGFVSLARSKFAGNEIFVHSSRKIGGVSFHPEVLNKDLFSRFIDWASRD